VACRQVQLQVKAWTSGSFQIEVATLDSSSVSFFTFLQMETFYYAKKLILHFVATQSYARFSEH
jgi:hypothetical protein